MTSRKHEHYMRRAIELTRNCPELPFGACIVQASSGQVLAEGWNRSGINSVLHGEIDAINRLHMAENSYDPSDCVLYTTAEPCPMCMGAAYWTGIGSIVFGTSIPFLIEHGWRQIDLRATEVLQRSMRWKCVLIGGVLEQDCNSLFAQGPPAG